MRSSIIFLDSAVTTIRSGLTARSGWIDRHPTASSARFLPFSSYGLVFFVCAFDAVFELAPVVEKLLDHFVAAGNIATDRSKVDNLTDVEFVRGLAAQVRPPSAFIFSQRSFRLKSGGATLRVAESRQVVPASYWTLAFNFSSGSRPRTDCATYSAVSARQDRAIKLRG
jgi:hypothetical protein